MVDTQRSLASLQSVLADNTAGAISEQDLRDAVYTSANLSGWGNYVDTAYTSGSPFALSTDADTALPNNKGSVLESHLPADVTTFYNGTTITGREGDNIIITVDFDCVPTAVGSTLLEVWFDIGGAVGELYRRPITFPKGQGEIRHVNFTTLGYTLDTWETNGATVYVRGNGTFDLYNIRYVISRSYWGGLRPAA